jgi:hypothetical protein
LCSHPVTKEDKIILTLKENPFIIEERV